MTPCPSEEEIAAFVRGDLNASAVDALFAHSASCATCAAVLAELRADVGTEVAMPSSDQRSVGRYELLHAIGAGGMGVVYVARDPDLDRLVAVKILRQKGGDRERWEARLRREAQTMARVSHPNVVTIYDVGTIRGRVFLAMELVDGTTLTRWLLDEARGWRTALDKYLLAGRGLAAAHALGIVHRDFKPDNVLVAKDGRVLVTDFGLAGAAPSGEVVQRSASGALLQTTAHGGTPAYMAPEQIRGDAVDARADVFSFCAALYESLYGERPFAGGTLEDLAASIASGAVRAPSRPARAPIWIFAILRRGLEARPEARYDTMEALIRALDPAPRSRRRTRLGLAGAVLALGAAAVSLGLALRSPTSSTRAPRVTRAARAGVRPAIAVLPLPHGDEGEGSRWMATALVDALRAELRAGEQVRVVADSESVRSPLSLPDAGSLPILRASDYFVVGSIAGDRVELSLVDAASGEALAVFTGLLSEGNLAGVAAGASAAFRQALDVPAPTAAELAAVRARVSPDPEAARLYAQGLERMRGFDLRGAREALGRSVEIDGAVPLARFALAQVMSSLGYEADAVREARAALDRAAPLSREERLGIEGVLRALSKDWKGAIEVDRALFTFFPDDVDYGLRLAGVQTRGGMAADALETAAALKRLASSDPRVDLAEAAAAFELSSYPTCRVAAASAATKAESLGLAPLVAQAWQYEGRVLMNEGRRRDAAAKFAAAERLFRDAGDEASAAHAEVDVGNAVKEDGQPLTVAEAAAHYERALATYRRLGKEDGIAAMLGSLATIASQRHDLATAKRLFEEGLAISKRTGDEPNVTANLLNLSTTLLRAGELDRACGTADEGRELARKIGNKRLEAAAVRGLAYCLFWRGDIAPAEKAFRRAIEMFDDLGSKPSASFAREVLAGFLLDSERTTDAVVLLEAAMAGIGPEGMPVRIARIKATLAKAELTLGHAKEARTAIDEARAVLATRATDSGDAEVLVLKIVAAIGTDAERAKGEARLAELVAGFHADGFVLSELEARLVAAESRQRGGQRRAAREELLRLESEATAKGVLRIARLAKSASR